MMDAGVTKPIRALFVCSQNSCRSQMAEGFLKQLGGDRFEVYSAGLRPGTVNPLAVKVMQEKGIDISGQTSDDIMDYIGKQYVFRRIEQCRNRDDKSGSTP